MGGTTGLYVRYLALALVFIATAVTFQLGLVMHAFEPTYLVVPVALVLVVGLSLGRAAVLKERLRLKSTQFRAIAELGQEFTFIRGLDGRFEYVSPACARLTGYQPADFYQDPRLLDGLIHPEDRERWRSHSHADATGGTPEPLDVRLLARDGRTVWISHMCGPVYDEDGVLVGYRSTNLDISDRKTFEDRIGRMAYRDPVTDLPNRRALVQRLEELAATHRGSGRRFAVLFLDLDRFKHINDTLGHSLGDELLQHIGARLAQCCDREGLISRFGGDEFVMVLFGLEDEAASHGVAERLLATVERPFELDGRELYVSGSIGIAFFPDHGEDAEALIRHADAAMFASKRRPHSKIHVFTPELLDDASAFLDTETRLREALEKRELEVHYQPLVDLADGRLVGLEALARWPRSGDEMVPPGVFIPVAEETGVINELGEQVLTTAARVQAAWQARGIALPVAVNISGRQLARHDFTATVERVVAETGCDPGLLEFEVTEEVFLQDMTAAVEQLTRLRRSGAAVVMDDFGTGYSSLTYLKDLPVDKVKIDRAFIQGITESRRDRAILRAILALCGDLALPTVVEGVETEAQRALLQELGAGVAQGFLFHRPQPLAEVEELLVQAGTGPLPQRAPPPSPWPRR